MDKVGRNVAELVRGDFDHKTHTPSLFFAASAIMDLIDTHSPIDECIIMTGIGSLMKLAHPHASCQVAFPGLSSALALEPFSTSCSFNT